MKNRQFRVLLVAILLQPVIVYLRWGYRVEDIHYSSNRDNIQYVKEYLKELDNNVEEVISDLSTVKINVLAIDEGVYEIEHRLGIY